MTFFQLRYFTSNYCGMRHWYQVLSGAPSKHWNIFFQKSKKIIYILYKYITISKRFKTVDEPVKSNSSLQLFFEVDYYKRFTITRNIAYGNKIFTFFKLNEFDKFYSYCKNEIKYLRI